MKGKVVLFACLVAVAILCVSATGGSPGGTNLSYDGIYVAQDNGMIDRMYAVAKTCLVFYDDGTVVMADYDPAVESVTSYMRRLKTPGDVLYRLFYSELRVDYRMHGNLVTWDSGGADQHQFEAKCMDNKLLVTEKDRWSGDIVLFCEYEFHGK